ncbi:hypothetical protein [Microbacterium sp. 18062]|uniref:hypothetical protein n=1 Tax=Microbacterium sp. 18062 TaxID=2681410 RepID=UPI00135943BE|nr:hypothetical protein [Microbacterium sp. 18062]
MTDASAEDATDAAEKPRQKWHEWFDVRFRTPAAIYGLIVYSALLMITSDHHEDVAGALAASVSTLVVFFFAHVFAYTLADHGTHPLGQATGYAITHSAGMLYAAIPPTIAMIIAGLQGLGADDATDYAVLATMAVLAFLGYVAYSRTGARIWTRLLGALGTALLGVFVAVLEYAFH